MYQPPSPFLSPGPKLEPDEWFDNVESLRSRLLELDHDRDVAVMAIKDEHDNLVVPYQVKQQLH
jgi:hypothetical protein